MRGVLVTRNVSEGELGTGLAHASGYDLRKFGRKDALAMADRGDEEPKIWVVSELYYPEDTSTGYYLTRIAEGLADRSDRPVRVLCGQPTYAARGRKTPWDETRRGVSIRRCWGTTGNKDHLLLRVLNLLTLSLSMFLQAVWRFRRGDRVLVVTNPPLLPFVISWACRLKGAKCVLLIHDVYPDVAVAAGLLKRSSFLTNLLEWAVSRLYRSMDRIIVLGRDMQALIAQKLPPSDERVQIIPNWADTDLIEPRSGENRLLRQWGLLDKFVLQYSGNMGRSHDLEAILAAAERLKHREDIHFLLVGSGAKKAGLKRKVEEKRLENVTLADRVPREDLPELLTAGDVALIAFVPGMAGISVPSRLYNMLAAGRPILAITDLHSEVAQVIQEENVGIAVPPGNALAFEEAILRLITRPELRNEMARRARLVAETTYQYSAILDAYCEVLALPPSDSREGTTDQHPHRRAA